MFRYSKIMNLRFTYVTQQELDRTLVLKQKKNSIFSTISFSLFHLAPKIIRNSVIK